MRSQDQHGEVVVFGAKDTPRSGGREHIQYSVYPRHSMGLSYYLCQSVGVVERGSGLIGSLRPGGPRQVVSGYALPSLLKRPPDVANSRSSDVVLPRPRPEKDRKKEKRHSILKQGKDKEPPGIWRSMTPKNGDPCGRNSTSVERVVFFFSFLVWAWIPLDGPAWFCGSFPELCQSSLESLGAYSPITPPSTSSEGHDWTLLAPTPVPPSQKVRLEA